MSSNLKENWIEGDYQKNEKTSHRMREIAANHISGKGLISRIYKNSYISTQENKQPNSKMGKGFE